MEEQNKQVGTGSNQNRLLFYYQPNEHQVSLAEKALLEKAAERWGEKKETNTRQPKAGTMKENIWILSGVILLYAGFGIASGRFVSSQNFAEIVQQIVLTVYLACGMMSVLLLGEIDFSAGSVIAVSGWICEWAMERTGVAVLAGILIGIACGSLIGCLNGYMISFMRIPSYIVTMATMYLGRGIVLAFMNGAPVRMAMIGGNVGEAAVWVIFFVILAVPVIYFVILSRTSFGRDIYAAGRDKAAAGQAGTNTGKVTFCVFVCSGFFASLTGILIMMSGYRFHIDMGMKMEVNTIAAVILGGTSLKGGKGSIFGTLAGVAFVCILNNGIMSLGINPFWGYVAQAILLLAAIYIDSFKSKKLLQAAGN